MAIELPPERTDTASLLRELEQNAPNPVPRNIRAAMIQAAKELEAWQRVAADAADRLDEAGNLRAGCMDSEARHQEIAKQIKLTMSDLAKRFRELQ